MSSSKLSKNHHYGCIGREEEHRKMMEVWHKDSKRIFLCHGGKESGKSCFIRNFLDYVIENKLSDSIIIDMDFKRERIEPKDSQKFWENLAKNLAKVKVETKFKHPMTEEILQNFFEEMKERKIIFLLDNLDYVRKTLADDKSCKTEEDLFSELQDNFIPGIVERTNLSMVFITSTVQLRYGQIAPRVHKIEMDPLSTESAGDLLLKVIQLTSDDVMDTEKARKYLGPYLQHIARLSEGIPTAIIMTGTQLTENSFFIKPKEMLTVLIFSRMYTLSPEFFPKEDNMFKIYGDYVERQSAGMKERLQEIGQMDNTTFEVDELMQHLSPKDGKAFFKAQTVKPLLLRNFIMYVGKSDKSETLEMPGFLRELIMIQDLIDPSKGLTFEDRLACMKVVSDCLNKLDIKLDEEKLKEIMENPQKYDEFVEQTISKPTPKEDGSLDTEKELEKNDLEKCFMGYLPEDILQHAPESDLSGLYQQKMQNLKVFYMDTDQDSHSSFNSGTPNAELQGEQTQDYILPGQLGEQLLRFNYNVSNMPESMGRSPQSIADAGFIYKEHNIFECLYCGKKLHRSHMTGNVDIMEKHREIDPRCPFVHLNQQYPLPSSSQQVKDKGAMKERRGREGTQGGSCVEEIEREFLQLGVKQSEEEANGEDNKNDKFSLSQNLSSSHSNKQYPENKMDFSEKDELHHKGPKEAENMVVFSAASSGELNYVQNQCTKETDESGAKENSSHEIDMNATLRKQSFLEDRKSRTSKDEGYGSPHNSDSYDPARPGSDIMETPE
ncbi:hypothetical protein CHS0354_006014 [Potamilus streckersoni]|uniref:Uncharacterized protein n=1 Tax=Potamilus streckersoni TaxID=2493646 RepID=A0AAE0VG03_9BIVA|nr:hypothetical protein CHS0354_006014 [Potamilus streckersoni]